jgi:hypothetical protein
LACQTSPATFAIEDVTDVPHRTGSRTPLSRSATWTRTPLPAFAPGPFLLDAVHPASGEELCQGGGQ